MARPALPRFLRAGDAIDAGVVVTSKGLEEAGDGRGGGHRLGADARGQRQARGRARAGRVDRGRASRSPGAAGRARDAALPRHRRRRVGRRRGETARSRRPSRRRPSRSTATPRTASAGAARGPVGDPRRHGRPHGEPRADRARGPRRRRGAAPRVPVRLHRAADEPDGAAPVAARPRRGLRDRAAETSRPSSARRSGRSSRTSAGMGASASSPSRTARTCGPRRTRCGASPRPGATGSRCRPTRWSARRRTCAQELNRIGADPLLGRRRRSSSTSSRRAAPADPGRASPRLFDERDNAAALREAPCSRTRW